MSDPAPHDPILDGFLLKRDVIRAFQDRGQDSCDPNLISAYQDIHAAFEIYKTTRLAAMMKRARQNNIPTAEREENYNYFAAVQRVMIAMANGAPFSSVFGHATQGLFTGGPLKPNDPHIQALALLGRMCPPNVRGASTIQNDLRLIIQDLINAQPKEPTQKISMHP